MKRRILAILTVLSLVLFAAMGILWVRSYWVTDTITLQYRHWRDLLLTNSFLSIESSTGGLRIIVSRYPHLCRDAEEMQNRRRYDFDHFGRSWTRDPSRGYPRGRIYNQGLFPGWRLGFGLGHQSSPVNGESERTHSYWATLPHAAILLPLAFVLRPRLRRYAHGIVQKRRQDRGLCVHCGYDLRANSDRCPECGTPIPSGAASEVPA